MDAHRVTRPLAGLVGLLVLVIPGVVHAQAAEDQEGSSQQAPTDWPAEISRLRQQMYERPGHALTRQQLATAYNNYGVGLGEQGQWELAIQQLQEAIALDETSEVYRNNLSAVYLNQAQDASTRHQVNVALEAVNRAITINPNSAQAYVLLGQIEYGRQKLKEAKTAWQRAFDLDPAQPGLAEQLAQVTEELPIESKFERVSQAYFDIRYEEQIERPVGFDIRDALLEARRSVGADFAYWPRHKVIVLIYGADSFRALRQETPEWAAGQFDGKIRVPLPSAQLNQAVVKQILYHEYTHALIYDLTNGKCPTWLNEGLAEYEGRTQYPGTLTQLQSAVDAQRWTPWQELSDHFSPQRSREVVSSAYEQSYSLAAYLIGRYGWWRIRKLLKAIADGQPWDAALAEILHLKLARLEADWRRWLPGFLAGAAPR